MNPLRVGAAAVVLTLAGCGSSSKPKPPPQPVRTLLCQFGPGALTVVGLAVRPGSYAVTAEFHYQGRTYTATQVVPTDDSLQLSLHQPVPSGPPKGYSCEIRKAEQVSP